MTSPAVLHVVAPLGGGVDRHVRDLVASVPRPQLLWHAGERADVLEEPAARRFLPLDRERLEREPGTAHDRLRCERVGLIHLHSVTRAARQRAEEFASALQVAHVVTLHDVLFLRPDAFEHESPEPDPGWLAQVEPILRSAKAVLAPSSYIADLATRHFPGLRVEVVPNGIAEAPAAESSPPARAAFLAHRPPHVVAVLGAIGPHKGSELLSQLATHLEGSGIAVVVIGYMDRQLYPGWHRDHSLFVHGPYQPEWTSSLLRAYGAELVLFPNRVAESFSYALSEAWAAGLPVLAGPRGAIGDRVRRHGAGWLLPEGFDAAQVAAELRRLFSSAATDEWARVKSVSQRPDSDRIPTLSDMSRSLDAYYRRFAIDPAPGAPADRTALERLAAANLDTSLFRQELIQLADACADAGQGFEQARRFEVEAREWIAKLERDVESLTVDLRAEVARRREVELENQQLAAVRKLLDRLPRFVADLLFRIANGRRD